MMTVFNYRVNHPQLVANKALMSTLDQLKDVTVHKISLQRVGSQVSKMKL